MNDRKSQIIKPILPTALKARLFGGQAVGPPGSARASPQHYGIHERFEKKCLLPYSLWFLNDRQWDKYVASGN
jgi:hypothetical protein